PTADRHEARKARQIHPRLMDVDAIDRLRALRVPSARSDRCRDAQAQEKGLDVLSQERIDGVELDRPTSALVWHLTGFHAAVGGEISRDELGDARDTSSEDEVRDTLSLIRLAMKAELAQPLA